MRLCCYFNYPPHYRESIYRKIDETFDTKFFFGRTVIENGKIANIKKLDFNIFRHPVVEISNSLILGRFPWRTKFLSPALGKYDAVLVTGDLCYSHVPLAILCRLTGKKLYGWGHGPKRKKGPLYFLHDFVLRNMTGYFTYGEKGKKRMEELGYEPSRIHTIYNSLAEGVRPEVTDGLESDIIARHFGNQNPTIFFIGRLTSQKQLHHLLEIISGYKKKGLDFNLLYIGDGPAYSELKMKTIELGIEDRVWFYGECHDENILGTMMYNCDLCCSPGNIGLTALHAMSYGVPVASHSDFETQMPEYETIVEGKTGFLFEKDNMDDLAIKMEKWLRDSMDKERRAKIRQECFSMIDTKWNSLNQIEILKKVLEERPG